MFRKKLRSFAKNVRVIARLDIKGPNVVKPVQTEALRIVGDPKKLAHKYYKGGADEIVYMDIVASLYGRNIDYELLKSTTEGIFIPFTIGGGIRSIHDINNALRAGADKVAINTYAISNPKFLKEAVKIFGAQCIVVAIDAKRQGNKHWEPYTDGGREKTQKDLIEWAKVAIDMGIGELIISSIDQEGTMEGYDLELIRRISDFSPIPVIAHAGAGKIEHILDAVNAGADAVSASSIFHYKEVKIAEVKKYLAKRGLKMRLL